MASSITLRQISGVNDIAFFWQQHDKYMLEDVIPNCTLGPALDEEDKVWFFSGEYREYIMRLFYRETDTLRIAFFLQDGQYTGFVVYVIYMSEDGKCFILDYSIEREQRNMGLGKVFYNLLQDRVKSDGATYIALNLSNENNERFWKSNGFIKSKIDEYGNPVYIKRLV